jgi:hypothetical protein
MAIVFMMNKEIAQHSEWNARKFKQKKIIARLYRVGGCPLSVCLSVCLGNFVE